MKKWLYFWISVVDILLLIWIGNHQFGMVPPLGKFLSPSEGFWQNGKAEKIPAKKKLILPGLKEEVEILFDKRQVPHIFARNIEDLYYTFGYITARNRLWQMESQARAVAGRLSEILGEKALKRDFFYRQAGILETCRRTLKEVESHSPSRKILESYSAGVNAYIQSLHPKDYPLEYKILGYSPEKWNPLKSVLLLKLMAWQLSGRHLEKQINMSRLLKKLSYKDWSDLFVRREEKEPVIPPEKDWNFQSVQGKGPETPYLPLTLDYSLSFEKGPSSQGSNNWAVSGKKTKSGFPLLASDPHLLLTLPSIWYEAQLVAPGLNVYGVAIPGSPVILIGFNSHIAWGLTNSEADVADLYEIQFKDKTRREYLYQGRWRHCSVITEKIRVRGGETRKLEVIYTHHGPVIYCGKDKNTGLALKWVGHRVSNELKTFLGLNRARNYEDYVRALPFYECPAQNFVFASKGGDIAIWHNGKLPIKWPGQGLAISSGENPLFEWKGFIPFSQLPHIKNPQRGFVSSANQYPVQYSSYPYFFGGFVFEEYRNKRINEVLRKKNNITPEDFQKLQWDIKNLQAASLLPSLLKMISPSSPIEKTVFGILQKWDFQERAEDMAPTIFNEWWKGLRQSIWEDDLGAGPYPSGEKTISIFLKKKNRWIDDRRTPKKETASDLARDSFQKTCRYLVEKFGPPGEKWAWGNYRKLHINHLGQIRGFGRELFVGGGSRTVNSITSRTGPSWRMVVSLEKEIKAWGIYPGGQSGNPGSPHYDEFVDDWARGKYYQLLFLKEARDFSKSPQRHSHWILKGKGGKEQ